MKILLLSVRIVAATAFFICINMFAADQTWKSSGFTDGNWATGGNWVGNAVPGGATGTTNGNTATFNGAANLAVTVDSTRNIKSILFDTGAGEFVFSNGGLFLTNAGSITINSGVTSSQTFNTPLTLSPTGSATYSFINNSSSIGVGLAIVGTVTGSATSTTTVSLTLGGSNNGSISGVVSNGSNSGAGAKISISKSGGGLWVLSGDNSYTGATNVNVGTLRINGNQGTASGTVTVADGATLGGSGTIGGATIIQNGGILAPGNSTGTLNFGNGLTLNSTSIINMEINNSTHDLINISSGSIAYNGTLNLIFSGAIDTGTNITLFSGSKTGSFTSIVGSGSYGSGSFNSGVWTLTSGGQLLTFTQSTGSFSVTAAAVPEPSTYAALLGALALAGTIAHRRRRQKPVA